MIQVSYSVLRYYNGKLGNNQEGQLSVSRELIAGSTCNHLENSGLSLPD